MDSLFLLKGYLKDLLRHHVQKKILFKRNMYRKDIERTCLNKLTKLKCSDMEKDYSNFFLMTATLQILKKRLLNKKNTLKPFDMELRKAIPKKLFVSEEENNCQEELNLTPQDKIGNIDWCKCEYECKLMAIFGESFC